MTKKQSVQTIRYIDDDKDADEENLTCHISQCTQRSPRSSLPCLKLLLHWMIMMTMMIKMILFLMMTFLLILVRFKIEMTHETI